jgi:hypothetical protein
MPSHRITEVALVALIGAAAAVTVTSHAANPSGLPSGLELASTAQSSALYCTGFSGSDGIAPADVVFTNTTSRPLVAPDATARLTSRNFPGRAYYGLSAIVDGGGVTASVIGIGTNHAASPCAGNGASTWSVAGLSTHVGTTAVLTLLNPTHTGAVVNIAAIDPTGVVTPGSYQGVVVGPHAVIAIPLNTEVIDALTVAAHVHAARGTVVVAAAMSWTGRVSGSATIAATPGREHTRVFPDLPTNNGASSTLALANPTDNLETVTVVMTIGSSALTPSVSATNDITPFSVTLAGFAETNLTVSPSSRVPAGGPASLVVRSSGPIVSELVTHATPGGGPWFSPPVAPARALTVVGGFTSLGSLLIVNRESESVSVTLRYVRTHAPALTSTVVVPAFSVTAVGAPTGGASYEAVVVAASGPVSVAGAVKGHPNGVRIIAGSGGG